MVNSSGSGAGDSPSGNPNQWISDAINATKQLVALLVLCGTVLASVWLYVKQDPSGPAPTPGVTLGDLIEDKASRVAFAKYFEQFAKVVESGYISSTGTFRATHRIAAPLLQDAGELPSGLVAFDQAVSERVTKEIGLADVALDEATRAKLAALLRSISAEVG